MKTRSHHLRYLSEPDPVSNDFQSVRGLQIPKNQYLFHNVTELSQLGSLERTREPFHNVTELSQLRTEQRGEPIA